MKKKRQWCLMYMNTTRNVYRPWIREGENEILQSHKVRHSLIMCPKPACFTISNSRMRTNQRLFIACNWLLSEQIVHVYGTNYQARVSVSLNPTIHALMGNESKKGERKIKFVFSEYFQIHGLEWLLWLFALKWFLDFRLLSPGSIVHALLKVFL